jgi:ankyrin repeat protein
MARDNNAAATASVQKRLGASLPGNLWDAARAGNPQQIEGLIHQGTPVDARDNESRTALMLAAMHGQTTTAQKLLALGANPRLVDREGMNAAQWAAHRGHARLAELLEAAR